MDDTFLETNTESFRWSVGLEPIQSELTLATFPGNLGALRARLGDDAGTLALEVGSDWDWVEINSLSLTLTVNSALLQLLDAGVDSVRVEFTSGLLIDREGDVELLPHTKIDVGPAYLAGTDIVLMFEGLQPMLSGRSVPLALSSLVSGDRFEGVYVTSGFIRVLNDYEFGGARGIQVDISRFMITASGISGQLRSAWPSGLSTRLFGLPDDDWELTLQSLELGLVDSFPELFRLMGSASVPLLPGRLEAEVSLQLGHADYAAKYRMRLAHPTPLPLDFGFATLRLDGLECEGAFGRSETRLVGRVIAAELTSDALSASVADAELRIEHSQTNDLFKIALSSLDFGVFMLPNASLVVERTYRDGGTELDVYVESALRWEDLADRLTLPDFMPTPPNSAQIVVKAHWEQQPDDSYALQFSLHLDLTEVERLWPFIPEPYRPAVDRAELILEVTAASDADIEYRIAGKLRIGLPDFAALAVPGFVSVTGGDADGRVELAFSIDDAGSLTLAAVDLVTIEGYLPGLELPAPFFVVDLHELGVSYDQSDSSRGEIAMSGRLALNPLAVPPSFPIATHLTRLLGQIGVGDIETDVEATLAFTSERVMLTLDSRFTGTQLSIDPLTMLSGLSAGRPAPQDVAAESETVTLDSRVGFGLDGLRLNIGELDTTKAAGSFEIEMTGHAFVAGFGAELYVAFSDEAIEVGVRGIEDPATGRWNTDLPVRLPLPPVSRGDIDACESLGWNVEQYAAERRAALATTFGLTAAELDAATVFDALKARAELHVKVALLTQIAEVRSTIAGHDRDTFVGRDGTLLDRWRRPPTTSTPTST